MVSTGPTSLISRFANSSRLSRVPSRWSRPPSRRSTVALSRVNELLSSFMVLPRPSKTSSTCPTVLSAFKAAWVRVLIRFRSGPLRTVLSAMRVIMTATHAVETTTGRRNVCLLVGGKRARSFLVEQPQRGLEPDRPGSRYRDRRCAAKGSGGRLGLARPGDQQPHLTRTPDGRQGESDSLRWRLGGVLDRHHRVVGLEDGGCVGEQRIDVALGPHSEQMDIEIRYLLAGFGVRREQLFVGQRRGGQVGAEFTVAGGYGMHLTRRDIDVIEQRLPGLLLVALAVVFGHVALVAPEQVHLRPVNRLGVAGEVLQQPDAVAAAGQHDQGSPPGRHSGRDDVDQSAARGLDQGVAVREDLNDAAHAYCTLSIPSRAAK